MSRHHAHGHSHGHSHVHKQDRLKQTLGLTVVSAVINLSLAVMKVVVGLWAHSHALFADGLHSFSDLVTDGLVYAAAYLGHKDADDDHPYGHERFETAGTLFVSLLLVLTGLGIFFDVIEHWGRPHHPTVHYYAFIVIIVSLVANEVLFHVTRLTANRIKSDLLLANAWHHRSDALSSFVVLLGILGSYYGYPECDIVAAIFVGVLIAKMGFDLTWMSIKELVDTAVPRDTQIAIKSIITGVPGVEALHELRTRQMGNKILVDVHLIVESHLTVSEGHFIGDQVQQALRHDIEGVVDVVVHIDAEDDEKAKPSLDLPARTEIELAVRDIAAEHIKGCAVDSLYIHYLAGKMEIDLICTCISKSSNLTSVEMERALHQSLSDVFPELNRCRLLFTVEH